MRGRRVGRLFTVGALFAALALGATACGGDDAEESTGGGGGGEAPKELTPVLAQFTFEARGEYAFLFLADEKGYFEEEGLDVSFAEGQGGATVFASMASSANEATIAIAQGGQTASAISQDIPLQAVATWLPESPSALGSKADVPLDSPEDLEGKTVGVNKGLAADLVFDALLKAKNLQNVRVRSLDPQVVAPSFARGDLDVMALFTTNDLPNIEAQVGEKLNVLAFEELGFPEVGATAVATKAFADANPDVIKGFLAAAARGLEDMKADTDEAAQVTKDSQFSVGLPDLPIVKEQVLQTLELLPEPSAEQPYGFSDEARWEAMVAAQLEYEVIEERKPIGDYFTNDYLPK